MRRPASGAPKREHDNGAVGTVAGGEDGRGEVALTGGEDGRGEVALTSGEDGLGEVECWLWLGRMGVGWE